MLTVSSSPVTNACNNATKFATNTPPQEVLCKRLDSEMRKTFVGPVPVSKFLDDFLPVQVPEKRQSQLWGFEAMEGIKDEKRMYGKFICSPFVSHPNSYL